MRELINSKYGTEAVKLIENLIKQEDLMLTIKEFNARQIHEWFQNRGGVSVWHSINLSYPGTSWTTPRLSADGIPVDKPHWSASSAPAYSLEDPAQVDVSIDKEVKRFPVSIRSFANGLALKLTDDSSCRVQKEVELAGEHAYHGLDYDTQEAVIYAPEKIVSLPEYIQGNQE